MVIFFKRSLLLLLAFFLINGCSENKEETVSDQAKQDHVWKSQVQALEKASDVEQALINAEKNRREIIDE